MPTILELGQKVKAKYPDYADMSDLEVGQKVKAKYPQDYADFEDVPETFKYDVPEIPVSREQKLQKINQETEQYQQESDKANSIGGFLGNFGKALVENIAPSEVGLGKTIGAIGSSKNLDIYTKNIQDLTNSNIQTQKLIKQYEAQGKDTTKLKRIYNSNADLIEENKKEIGDYSESLPTTGQALGQLGGTALDLLTAGTYGKATTGMTSFTRGKALPSILPQGSANFFSKETGKDLLKQGAVGYGFDVTQGMQGNRGEDRTGSNALIPGLGTVIGVGIPLAGRGLPALKKTLTPNSEDIMNRVARLNPLDAQKFKKMTGESHGAYLERTGNMENPTKIVENEARKFTDTLAEKDAVLESLPGVFKSKELDMVLDDLAEREMRIGVSNAESKRIAELYNKNKTQGLTQGEINEIKRTYEREVKLGYQKEQNSIGIARSTRLDTALREWQDKLAKDAGLKNLPQLSKQIQASKFIVDKLGKQLTGKVGNDALGLGDLVILSGGDPTAVLAYIAKKTFLNKGTQANVARLFSKIKPPQGAIKAEFGGKSGLPAKISGRDYGTTIEMRPPKTPTTYEPQSPKINRSSSLPEQKLLPAGNPNMKSGATVRLPTSARKTNLGLNEVSQTTRKGTLPPQLSQKQSKKSYPIIPPKPKKGNLLDKFKNLPNKQGGMIQAYKGEKDLTTKILKDLEGKTTVSKQYILDATNRGELKQVERDLIRELVKNEPDIVNVADFAKKVKAELLPLKVKRAYPDMATDNPKFEHITLPDDLRGKVKLYDEHVYESPIKTSAGDVHFGNTKNYFGHTRIEDMADNKTRRVIEVQSDLYQKGNLANQIDMQTTDSIHLRSITKGKIEKLQEDLKGATSNVRKDFLQGEIKRLQDSLGGGQKRVDELSKLQQYNDPTAHFRMVREEIKKAAQDGKTKLQFPTGETALRIEGLGNRHMFYEPGNARRGGVAIESLKPGKVLEDVSSTEWVVHNVLGEGKFTAVSRQDLHNFVGGEMAKTGRKFTMADVTDYIKNCL